VRKGSVTVRRVDEAARRVMPAQQRFGGGDLKRVGVGLRLVVLLELFALQRHVQVVQLGRTTPARKPDRGRPAGSPA
jgi:hypothetical protein